MRLFFVADSSIYGNIFANRLICVCVCVCVCVCYSSFPWCCYSNIREKTIITTHKHKKWNELGYNFIGHNAALQGYTRPGTTLLKRWILLWIMLLVQNRLTCWPANPACYHCTTDTGPGTTFGNEMDFGMNQVQKSLVRPFNLQSSALPLCYDCL